jgi:hypothetical protein
MNIELEIKRKKIIVAWFEILSWYLPRRTGVSLLIVEPVTFRIEIKRYGMSRCAQ